MERVAQAFCEAVKEMTPAQKLAVLNIMKAALLNLQQSSQELPAVGGRGVARRA